MRVLRYVRNVSPPWDFSKKQVNFGMVKIRMKAMGRLHRPFYRICVMDAKTPRDGRVIEELGHYDPLVRDAEAREVLNKERAAYWLSCGAQPTEKVAVLLKRHGVTNPAAKKA